VYNSAEKREKDVTEGADPLVKESEDRFTANMADNTLLEHLGSVVLAQRRIG
jgi:hypothetical protein